MNTNEEFEYTIVSFAEVDLSVGRISNEPRLEALMGNPGGNCEHPGSNRCIDI